MRRPYPTGKSSVGEIVVLQERFEGSNCVVCEESRLEMCLGFLFAQE